MIEMICDRAHISTVYGSKEKGDTYPLDSEGKADHHESIGLGHRAKPKAKPQTKETMAKLTGQKK